MVTKSTFHGTFYSYQNINGKEKKVVKEFTDQKKYEAFVEKHPMPTLGSMLTLAKKPVKKALPAKKISKKK